jgi:hypothetical protein
VVLAVLAGTGVGLLLGRQDGPKPLAGADGELPPGVQFVTPQPSITAVPSPPTVAEVRPRTQVVVVPPSPLPTPTPSPTPSPTPTAAPALALSPAGGTNDTAIAVTGHRLHAGDQVRLDYLDAAGRPHRLERGRRRRRHGQHRHDAGRAGPGRHARPPHRHRHRRRRDHAGDERGLHRGVALGRRTPQPRRCCSISATRKLSSSAWLVLSRGSQAVS